MNRNEVCSLFATLALSAAAVVTAAGCGRPFDVKTAPGFVELENQSPSYDYRATTPEGVVLSIRAVDNAQKKGDLAFWTRAVTLQMRDVSGYAMLDTKDVASKDGTKGKQLTFGHDEDGKPFTYWVTLFLAQDRLFLVEAGGAKEQLARYQPSIEWMENEVAVRCKTFVSPVLASSTCNRW
jgi:hypothetical protein